MSVFFWWRRLYITLLLFGCLATTTFIIIALFFGEKKMFREKIYVDSQEPHIAHIFLILMYFFHIKTLKVVE